GVERVEPADVDGRTGDGDPVERSASIPHSLWVLPEAAGLRRRVGKLERRAAVGRDEGTVAGRGVRGHTRVRDRALDSGRGLGEVTTDGRRVDADSSGKRDDEDERCAVATVSEGAADGRIRLVALVARDGVLVAERLRRLPGRGDPHEGEREPED